MYQELYLTVSKGLQGLMWKSRPENLRQHKFMRHTKAPKHTDLSIQQFLVNLPVILRIIVLSGSLYYCQNVGSIQLCFMLCIRSWEGSYPTQGFCARCQFFVIRNSTAQIVYKTNVCLLIWERDKHSGHPTVSQHNRAQIWDYIHHRKPLVLGEDDTILLYRCATSFH